MKPRRWSHLLFALLAAYGIATPVQTRSQPFAESTAERVIIEPLHPGSTNEITHHIDTGLWVATNGVIARYGLTALLAQEISFNEQSGEAVATGDVTLRRATGLWRGEMVAYNFKTEEMRATAFRLGMAPFYAAGEGLSAIQSNRTYITTNAFITSDDFAKPSYRIHAKRLKIIPGELIEAEQATMYFGKVPVMFFPSYHRNLGRHPNNFSFTPGYRSIFGPFLLTAYNWHWSTNLNGAIHLDYRQKRGLAGGPDVNYDLGRLGQGLLSAYYLRDEDARTPPSGEVLPENRYRINFSHHVQIRTNLTARIVAEKQSDSRVIHDFYEGDYRENPQPKSFLEVNQLWPNFSLNVLAQAQLNDFFQTVERLPDIRFTGFRQQLGVSPVYYESESSVGYFRFQPMERALTNEYSAIRGDSFHQLLLPQTYLGWLNFTPRVGGRFTHYGATDGENLDLDQQDRFVFNTGAELSFKASRTSEGARSRFWEVNGLRHIIQPSLNYVFVPQPNVRPRELPQFDTEIPSLRLLPVDFPDYNSIDSIDSRNVLRLSLRNKVQTKRQGEIDTLLNWGLYTDLRLDPGDGQDSFADLFSDFDLKPRSWITISSELRYDVGHTRINFANHLVTLEPNDVWNVSFGHLYFRGDSAFGPDSKNNLLRSSLWYRFNENWAARLTHHYEVHHGVLEEQYYTLYRDLRSWTAALTFRTRENRAGEDDFTVAITFSLKAFPRFGLGRDKARHYMLLGS
jgi:LPS-assembly protein